MKDQRICIKFCVKNEIKRSAVVEMLQKAYGERAMKKTAVYDWYGRFREGREEDDDDDRSGRPSSSSTDENITKVKAIVLENRRITIRECAEDLNISYGSCEAIITHELGMRRVAAKMIPKLLNFQQKQYRKEVAQQMLNDVENDPELLKRVITGDESWVYGYDVETKTQSSQWKTKSEPRPKKARQVRSNVKVLITVFFDWKGVVHYEFLPRGRTVNKEYYVEVLRHLREAIRKKRPELWANKTFILHHDNAPAHASRLVSQFLTNTNTSLLTQPPYSPDLSPCDFFLFPKIKKTMKGKRYANIEDIKTASLKELKAIPQNAFENCFQDWKKRWHKCIISDGDYFEGDNINIKE